MWVTLSGGGKRTERGRRRGREALTQSLELLGGGGTAFQRGMMEVFVIERRDEMRRVGTDGATDEGGETGRSSRGIIMTK